MKEGAAGVTLIEVTVAVSLLALLSVGVLTAMRLGLSAMDKSNQKLIDNRRVAGTQRILQQQMEGFMPVLALCGTGPEAPRTKMPFFQGEPQAMRLVSTYSLQQASRGYPQILEFQVIPGEQGRGVRLVVNENLYTGPLGAGLFCIGGPVPRYRPIDVGPGSFVLADRLAFCSFSYLEPLPPAPAGTPPPRWVSRWTSLRWPLAVSVQMQPLEEDVSRLRPVTIVAPIHVNRSPEIDYGDY